MFFVCQVHIILLVLLLPFTSALECCSGSCTVSTTTGQYAGVEDSDGIRFLSVRYAQPPLGSLRFADPVAFFPDGNTTYPASTLPPFCIQNVDVPQSEDCLFLNVFRPQISSQNTFPVLVWIHGGSFYYGGSSDPVIYGANLAKQEKIIVVTINYRLGLLGFLDDGNNTNFAIKDVILALKWVKQNIATFGGDSGRVSVGGQSSGGGMIRALLSTINSIGLYRNVIIQSDPMDFGFNTRTTSVGTISTVFASATGCTTFACARGLGTDSILAVQAQIIAGGHSLNSALSLGTPIAPVIDGTLIKKDFGQYIEQGTLPVQVPALIGTTKDEANSMIEEISADPLNFFLYPFALQQIVGTARAAIILASLQFVPNLFESDAARRELGFFSTLFLWTCAVQKNVLKYVKTSGKNVYLYEFEAGINYPEIGTLSLCQGSYVCHQADIYPLFGTFNTSAVSSDQVRLSDEVQARWGAFIKSGNPNTGHYINWPVVENVNRLNALRLGQGKIAKKLYSEKCGWLLGGIIKFDYELYSR
ncbi:Carboxylesterase [Lipomyces japonicus]|uniref:Carboxylesterase n=1 Tax=Lipomyces japonicus TaxID=56871 RepID=UPI0034CDA74C